MWEVSNYNQIVSFLVSFAFGALYCLAYDVLRSARKVGCNGTFKVAVQDIAYFIIIAFVTYMIMLVYTCGEIRFYILFAIFLGFVTCNYTLSRFFRKILVTIFKQIAKLLRGIKAALRRFKFNILRLFSPIKDFLVKILKNFIKTLKNLLKRRRKVVYTKIDV